MVLVSKLFGSSRQASSTNSIFGRLRSNICRNASKTHVVQLTTVESFVGETSCDSPIGRKEVSVAWLHHEDDIVNLSDFNYGNPVDEISQSRRWITAPASFCESHCDNESDRQSRSEDTFGIPRLQSRHNCPPIHIESIVHDDTETRQEDDDALLIDLKAQTCEHSRLLGGSCEQPGKPPQVQSAWGSTKAASISESRKRFPSRLPPLEAIGSKNLRSLGSTKDCSHVVEICDFPESSSPFAPVEHS